MNADEFIPRLSYGYDTVIGEGGMTLSGGQKQRLGIARRAENERAGPDLRRADFGPRRPGATLVIPALLRLMAGRTVFIIANRLSTARQAHRIVVLDGGRVVETSARNDLRTRDGIRRRLYAIQSGEEPAAVPAGGGALNRAHAPVGRSR